MTCCCYREDKTFGYTEGEWDIMETWYRTEHDPKLFEDNLLKHRAKVMY